MLREEEEIGRGAAFGWSLAAPLRWFSLSK
jgi:hypothetical protein